MSTAYLNTGSMPGIRRLLSDVHPQTGAQWSHALRGGKQRGTATIQALPGNTAPIFVHCGHTNQQDIVNNGQLNNFTGDALHPGQVYMVNEGAVAFYGRIDVTGTIATDGYSVGCSNERDIVRP